jgi:hypothetical protein
MVVVDSSRSATAVMDSGDCITVSMMVNGVYQLFNIHAQGSMLMVHQETTGDSALFKPSGNLLVKGPE